MKWIGVLAAAAVLASPAAAKPDPHYTLLAKQITQLQLQVNMLRQQLEVEQNWRVCMYAMDQDSFRVAFKSLSLLTGAVAGQNVPAWEQIPRYDDKGACAAVGVTRP